MSDHDLVGKLAQEIARQEMWNQVFLFFGCALLALLFGFTFGRGWKLIFKLLPADPQQLSKRDRYFALYFAGVSWLLAMFLFLFGIGALFFGSWNWYHLNRYSDDLAEGIVDGLKTGSADVPWVVEGDGPGLPKAIVTNIIIGQGGSKNLIIKDKYDLSPSMCHLLDSLIKERMSRKIQPAPTPPQTTS